MVTLEQESGYTFKIFVFNVLMFKCLGENIGRDGRNILETNPEARQTKIKGVEIYLNLFKMLSLKTFLLKLLKNL